MKTLCLFFLCSIALWLGDTARVSAQPQGLFSPRDYCEHRGGVVSETGNKGIYICCYRQRQKCLLSNIDKGYSRVIQMRTAELKPVEDRGRQRACGTQ